MLVGLSDLEQTLRRLRGDLYAAIDRLALPAVLVDPTGTVVYENTAANREFGRVRRRRFQTLYAPESQALAREAFARKIVGSATTTEFSATVVLKDGRQVPAEISSVALKSDGHVVGVFGLIDVGKTALPDCAARVAGVELTPRQSEVLQQLAAGFTTDQMAESMGIATHTVRNHVRDLLARLNVHTRLEAVVRGHELGLV
jgi:PAS domain S-box-containing protein